MGFSSTVACRDLTVSVLDDVHVRAVTGLALMTEGDHVRSLLDDGPCQAYEQQVVRRLYGVQEFLPCRFGCVRLTDRGTPSP